MLTNGWGVCSIDGSDEGVRMYIKNSRLELTGPRAHGYGTFCIGDNEIIWENSTVDVNGYPMLVMGMMGKGHAAILDSKVRGRRFGAMVVSDDNSVFDIKGSDFKTGNSSIVVKGSATTINIENTRFEPGNGVVLQLMDSDEGGMDMAEFIVPIGEEDVYTEGRDLTAVTEEDVIVNIADCTIKGNMFNSTSNIRPTDRCPHGGMGKFHDTVIGHLSFPAPEPGAELPPPRHGGDDLKGAKNLGLTLKNTKIEGQISAAKQAYREGVTVIREDNRLELTNITQWAAPTVNNGIVLSLDKDCVWTVTGESYLTELRLEDGAVIQAPEGKTLSVTLDGAALTLAAGDYKGKIALSVC